MSYYQISKITQFLICIGLSLVLISLFPWPWLRELLAIVIGWRVFGFLRKRLKARRLIQSQRSPEVSAPSLGLVTILMLFSGVMSFFVLVAMVL